MDERLDKMKEEYDYPEIYQEMTKKTFLFFINENLLLINKLLKEKSDLEKSNGDIYKRRAISLQTKLLLGVTGENLLKIILLKRGFIINQINKESSFKFNPHFIKELEDYNSSENKDQSVLDKLYQKSLSQFSIFDKKLISFKECITIFNKSNSKEYFKEIKQFNLDNLYLNEFKNVNSNNALTILKDLRNSYVHKAESNFETNGIFHYLFNFILFICKKEFLDFFKDLAYSGEKEIKDKFLNIKPDSH